MSDPFLKSEEVWHLGMKVWNECPMTVPLPRTIQMPMRFQVVAKLNSTLDPVIRMRYHLFIDLLLAELWLSRDWHRA